MIPKGQKVMQQMCNKVRQTSMPGFVRRENHISKNRKPGLDSRGSSLIEVIVAMLVLAMIIIPMLDMFTSAGRTNARARSRQYAGSVLENVLEEVRAGNFVFSHGAGVTESSELRDSANRLTFYSAMPDDGVLSGKSFETANILQGTREYQARISFDAEQYKAGGSGLNDYQMPDINSYDTSNSEMILLDAASDSFVVAEFYRQYTEQGSAEYQQRLNDAWMQSDAYLYITDPSAWYEKWKEAHSDTPDAEPTEADRPVFDGSQISEFVPVSEEIIKSYIKRDTVVKIMNTGEGDYTICYTVTYTAEAPAAALNLDAPFVPLPYDYTISSGSRYHAEDLKYIYIFYQPFDSAMSMESLVLDAETISREPLWNCRLYLAVQEGTTTNPLNFRVQMDPRLTAEECAERLQVLSAGGLNGYDNPKELVPSRQAEDKVYRITVQIVEAGTDEVVAEADTTIYCE